jgi:dihydrofolate reductase
MKISNMNVGLIRPVSIIVAVDEEGGFGKEGEIPWHYPEDLKHFQSTTKNSTCIMGRLTYLNMYDMIVNRKAKGDKKKPVKLKNILPNRESIVISRSIKEVEGARVESLLRKAIETASKKKIFIIGGERLYTEALPWTDTIHLTIVKGRYDCDRHFPIGYVKRNFKIHSGQKLSDDLLAIKYIRK